MASRVTHRRPVAMALGALLLAAPLTATAADQRPLQRAAYNTERMLEHLGNECAGIPACTSVGTPAEIVEAGQLRVVAVSCPDDHPFALHWDTEQHEHMYVRVISRTRTGMTFSLGNKGDAPGHTRIFLGCSSAPPVPGGRGVQLSRGGVPSKLRMPARGIR